MRSVNDGGGARRETSPPVINAPFIVLATVAALVAAHVALMLLPASAANALEWAGAVSPRRFIEGLAGRRSIAATYPPLATHMLLHSGFMHLFLNSVWLVAFGTPVARRLGAKDRARSRIASDAAFLSLFVLSGIVGALAYVGLHQQSTTILIGASGGVSGLLGGFVRFGLERRQDIGGDRRPLSSLLARPVLAWTAAIIVLNAGFGFFAPALGFGSANVAWEAHIGGYLFGLLAFPAFVRASQN
jgi:membrane associated rhomboid family serine protease